KIKEYPEAPSFLPSIARKLQFALTQDYDVTISLIEEQLKMNTDETMRKKLLNEYLALTTERDLKCLNEGKRKKCNTKNIFDEAYFFDGQSYKSPRKYSPYKIKMRAP